MSGPALLRQRVVITGGMIFQNLGFLQISGSSRISDRLEGFSSARRSGAVRISNRKIQSALQKPLTHDEAASLASVAAGSS